MSKLLKTCIALVAFAAFAVLPGTASAENDITVVNVTNGVHGAVTPLATLFNATSNHTSTTRLTDASGVILATCTTEEITGELIKNDHTAVEGNITAATFKGKSNVDPHTTHCSGSMGDIIIDPKSATNGLPWCLQTKAADPTDSFRLRGNACNMASRPIRIASQITTIFGIIFCDYEHVDPIIGTFNTGTTPTLKMKKVEFGKVFGGGMCPSKVFLDLEMQLHRDPGEVALVNAT